MEEVKTCPICSSGKNKQFLSCKDFTVSQEVFNIVACEGCGFRFTSPRPSVEDIGRYYKSDNYISHSDTRKGVVNKLYHWVRSYTLIKKLQLVLKNSPRGKILDFGCGTGTFLETCKNNKWDVLGLEPDSTAREIAQQRCGQKIFEGIGSFDEALPNEKIDVITLWHVLEHIHDLEEWFGFINRHLKSDGVLIVAVPNCSSFDAIKFSQFWAAYDLPRHLWHFTPRDIASLFKKHNYELIKTNPMVFDSYYLTMLSQKNKCGKTNLLSSFLTGLLSNLKAIKTGKEFSSQIYILRKA